MESRHAKLIAEYCKRTELEAMLLDEKLSYWAMHEAEKVLNPEQICEYAERWIAWNSTASERAEAFLRTLGLWKDDQ